MQVVPKFIIFILSFRIEQFQNKLIRGSKKLAAAVSSKPQPTTFEHLLADYKDVRYIPGPHDVLKAFTLTHAGEEYNMERLEILGDVFLKYSVGIRLFGNKEYSSFAEGVLSQKRSQIVGNKRLYKTAIKQDFPSLISAQKFEPYLNFMAPRFSQKDGLEETICKMDEEFTSKSRLLSTKGDISDGSSKTGQHDITSQSITQLLTQDDVKTLSDSNMDQETQEKLIRLALSRYQDEFSTNRHNRYSLRQYVRINDKSLADTVESLLGCYLELAHFKILTG